MKALVEKLEWLKLYINGGVDRNDLKMIAIAQDEMIGAMAIAEALPEISMTMPAQISPPAPTRRPHTPIIALDDRSAPRAPDDGHEITSADLAQMRQDLHAVAKKAGCEIVFDAEGHAIVQWPEGLAENTDESWVDIGPVPMQMGDFVTLTPDPAIWDSVDKNRK